ncbi:MAG: hypothetical protein LQ349_008125 [Xanthoria aureola]|nr:MAG: hypothetical protein LQ349_008125 [Xanthoria aureola]
MYLFLLTSLFFFQLSHLVTAECPDCSSYSAALTSCQSKTTSGNLTITGSKIDTGTVDCMCVSNSNTAQMNSCQGCYAASATLNTNDEDVDVSLLLSWYYVCKANDQWGNQQGAACWQGQPLDFVPCVSNTVKKGGGSASGGSGGSGTSSSLSTPAASPAAEPAGAKSAATVSYDCIQASLFGLIGLAVVLVA